MHHVWSRVLLGGLVVLAGCGEEPPEVEPTLDGAAPARDAGQPPPVLDAGLGPPDGPVTDEPSHGGTITFEAIGATGWYPSVRDPASGPCDAHDADGCCLARQEVTSDRLTPWNEDLVMTLRGPIHVRQFAVYQPSDGPEWSLVSSWDERSAGSSRGVSFRGGGTEVSGFDGRIGSECLVDVSTALPFPGGAGSVPYCESEDRFRGWSGSKLFVLLASMPHASDPAASEACSEGTDGNWYDAPWIGLSLGELVRAGAFSGCHCYARDPAQWWLGDGCGQFNAFEVVNDNNDFRNLDVFSTNFFGYGGYVGEGPCGADCDVSALGPEVDLIDKSTSLEARAGAVAGPGRGPGAAFRRPSRGERYFLILLDEASRTVQLAVIHPAAIPAELSAMLPALPAQVVGDTVQALLSVRLPR